jgi:hypothetical protein
LLGAAIFCQMMFVQIAFVQKQWLGNFSLSLSSIPPISNFCQITFVQITFDQKTDA